MEEEKIKEIRDDIELMFKSEEYEYNEISFEKASKIKDYLAKKYNVPNCWGHTNLDNILKIIDKINNR